MKMPPCTLSTRNIILINLEACIDPPKKRKRKTLRLVWEVGVLGEGKKLYIQESEKGSGS